MKVDCQEEGYASSSIWRPRFYPLPLLELNLFFRQDFLLRSNFLTMLMWNPTCDDFEKVFLLCHVVLRYWSMPNAAAESIDIHDVPTVDQGPNKS